MRPVLERNSSKPDNKVDQSSAHEIVVFWIRRDSMCDECGEELGSGRFLYLDQNRPLCLACAELDHLVFVARGDAALTRRARRYSALSAVVVRFSRTRKRYERQGLLVEESALIRAEQECLSDADARERARERAAERQLNIDAAYVDAFARRVAELYPNCPANDQHVIAEHACEKYSDRIGRSAAAKELLPSAIELAVRAHIRHRYTPYDELLGRGVARDEARAVVAASVEDQIDHWRHEQA